METFYHEFSIGGTFTKAEVKELKEDLEFDTEYPVKFPRNGKKPLVFSFADTDMDSMDELCDWLTLIIAAKPGRMFIWRVLPKDEYNGSAVIKESVEKDVLSDSVIETHFMIDKDGIPITYMEPLLHQDERAELINKVERIYRFFDSDTGDLAIPFRIEQ